MVQLDSAGLATMSTDYYYTRLEQARGPRSSRAVLAAALITDFSALPTRDRNLLRLRFLSGTTQHERFGAAETEEFAREAIADRLGKSWCSKPALFGPAAGGSRLLNAVGGHDQRRSQQPPEGQN
ncbi:MAG TPA: hypothetical protein VFT31_05035 [Kribbella sp.]|nr:hypothetical protein [Kribbella sp.]